MTITRRIRIAQPGPLLPVDPTPDKVIGTHRTPDGLIYQIITKRENGKDTITIDMYTKRGQRTVVLTPSAVALLDRQRATLTKRSRSRAGKKVAAQRKALGLTPGFMKKAKE